MMYSNQKKNDNKIIIKAIDNIITKKFILNPTKISGIVYSNSTDYSLYNFVSKGYWFSYSTDPIFIVQNNSGAYTKEFNTYWCLDISMNETNFYSTTWVSVGGGSGYTYCFYLNKTSITESVAGRGNKIGGFFPFIEYQEITNK